MFDVPKEVIEEALAKAIEVLKDKHEDLGMTASGRWKEELEGEAQTNLGIIKGAKYTYQLVHGRKPGKRPPISALTSWVEDKFGYRGQEAKSMAFAVANKIAERGTSWFEKGGSDLLEILESKEVQDSFFGYIGAQLKVIVSEQLTRDLKRLL